MELTSIENFGDTIPYLDDDVMSVDEEEPTDERRSPSLVHTDRTTPEEPPENRGENSSGCGDSECKTRIECLVSHLQKLQLELRTQRVKAEKLESEVKKYKERRKTGAQVQRTWIEKFKEDPEIDVGELYRLSCSEENGNWKHENLHPFLQFRPATNQEMGRINDYIVDAIATKRGERDIINDLDSTADPVLLLANPDADVTPTAVVDPDRNYICALPKQVVAKIFYFAYKLPKDSVIHAISRLDPFHQLLHDLPPTEGKRSGLLNRFYISSNERSYCSLTFGSIKPNDFLAPLSVCKSFLFFGTHAAYGLNTFAFSSLGEFGRFCKGIGEARAQRIQHVELLWVGSQTLTWASSSRRTWPLASFCIMPRLRTLVLYVNESGKEYTRRAKESGKRMNFMAQATDGQPNYRLNRNMRGLQGIDYIYQLRGLKCLRIFDFQAWVTKSALVPIRDWSFLVDLETVTSRPKPDEALEEEKLCNLKPVVGFPVPDEDMFKAIDLFYEDSGPCPKEEREEKGFVEISLENRPDSPEIIIVDDSDDEETSPKEAPTTNQTEKCQVPKNPIRTSTSSRFQQTTPRPNNLSLRNTPPRHPINQGTPPPPSVLRAGQHPPGHGARITSLGNGTSVAPSGTTQRRSTSYTSGLFVSRISPPERIPDIDKSVQRGTSNILSGINEISNPKERQFSENTSLQGDRFLSVKVSQPHYPEESISQGVEAILAGLKVSSKGSRSPSNPSQSPSNTVQTLPTIKKVSPGTSPITPDHRRRHKSSSRESGRDSTPQSIAESYSAPDDIGRNTQTGEQHTPSQKNSPWKRQGDRGCESFVVKRSRTSPTPSSSQVSLLNFDLGK